MITSGGEVLGEVSSVGMEIISMIADKVHPDNHREEDGALGK